MLGYEHAMLIFQETVMLFSFASTCGRQ